MGFLLLRLGNSAPALLILVPPLATCGVPAAPLTGYSAENSGARRGIRENTVAKFITTQKNFFK